MLCFPYHILSEKKTFSRYNSATGRFIVPQGEAGLYYFYTDLITNDPEDLYFAIRVNEQFLCRAALDIRAEGPDDNGSPSCGAVALLAEGKNCVHF